MREAYGMGANVEGKYLVLSLLLSLSLFVCVRSTGGCARSTLEHVNTRVLGVSLFIFSLTSYAAGVTTVTTHRYTSTLIQ